MSNTIPEFDPLVAKNTLDNEVAIKAMKRELNNILDSYVGWYDPFCELIQNALDAIDEKIQTESKNYKPKLRVIINIKDNSIIVSDNGIGLIKDKYQQFLAPSFSFKSGATRGHKGVGATYLAYGYNYIQISTRTSQFKATGYMVDARKWLSDENPAGNPKVQPDQDGPADKEFEKFESGVSVQLKFDKSTHPADLSWVKATTAEQWYPILAIKTGLGAFFENNKIHVIITVIDGNGQKTEKSVQGISYYWPHQIIPKKESLRNIKQKENQLYQKSGKNFRLPSSMTNLDAIYDRIDASELQSLIELDEDENIICQKYQPAIYFCYMYSAKVWSNFNDNLKIRQNMSVLAGGIQIAANNMPQGELIQIPLVRNIGRQNQVHFVFHFDNCRADLGRKGFQKEIVEFSKSIARKVVDKPINQVRHTLRPVTGVRPDLLRENEVEVWKDEMEKHEKEFPLVLINENFFLPVKQIAITSKPTREQDVIALFNQLIAGGVIRGIRVMSTNERFTYDGMYRIVFDDPSELYIYDPLKNPLGVLQDYIDSNRNFISKPKILEYKYSLDALVEDIENGEKNSNDISLVVVWETGQDFIGNYHITSLLDSDNLSYRQYHGITHVMTNTNSGQREMDLIVLEELLDYLADPEKALKYQKEKYEEE